MSSLNKPQNSNKLFAYFILRQIWGQSFGTKLSGVHKSRGQILGQFTLPGRRGLGEPKGEVWDPLGKPQSITKVG